MLAKQLVEPLAFHAEGPVWWPDDGTSVGGTLRYVDLMAGRVITVSPDRPHEAVATNVGSSVAAFLRPRRGGGAVVCTEHGLSLASRSDLTDLTPWVELVSDADVRFNDGGCAPDGTLYAGTMRYDQAPGGAGLFAVGADAGSAPVLDDVTVSNGIGWSPSGELAYYNDTPTRTTWVFDWSPEAGLTDRRALFTVDDDGSGGPDGLCVDADGNVWTAIYGGSRVEARDPRGRLVERIELPVTNVTACTFGGTGLDQLFITTTRENVPDGEQPSAGAVFIASPGAAGQPVTPFAG